MNVNIFILQHSNKLTKAKTWYTVYEMLPLFLSVYKIIHSQYCFYASFIKIKFNFSFSIIVRVKMLELCVLNLVCFKFNLIYLWLLKYYRSHSLHQYPIIMQYSKNLFKILIINFRRKNINTPKNNKKLPN